MRMYSKTELVATTGVCKKTVNHLIEKGYLEGEQLVPGGMTYYTEQAFNKAKMRAMKAVELQKQVDGQSLRTQDKSTIYTKSKRVVNEDEEKFFNDLLKKHYGIEPKYKKSTKTG